jgi:adenine-specific DNA-methyltransferase
MKYPKKGYCPNRNSALHCGEDEISTEDLVDDRKMAQLNQKQDGSVVAFAARLVGQYEAATSGAQRKARGQIFTPPEISRFMASLLPTRSKQFRLLDPGAGIGSLAAGVCERFLQLEPRRNLEVHLFENDPELLPRLRANMENCREALRQAGHSMSYKIHPNDFILWNLWGDDSQLTLFPNDAIGRFDGVVMNPPYFKINRGSPYAKVMEHVVHGQPNIYALFLAAAAQSLRSGGTLVAITPRSFCNGLYFRGFRRWFFGRMSLEHIHLFQSRTHAFREANVLQESVITVSRRRGEPAEHITITTSHGRQLDGALNRQTLSAETVLDDACGDKLVRIPETAEDARIIDYVESWESRFTDVGLRISTGPVVLFRAAKFLLRHPSGSRSAPLLSAHNVRPFETVWPIEKKDKPAAFQICPDSVRHLVRTRNYVLLRRFTAKEEHRRLVASCFLSSSQPCSYVALENHLNYVYHEKRDLSGDEVFGIASLFNSVLLDRYFRSVSGNTQVNATEVRTMKFPEMETIARIGKHVRNLGARLPREVEQVVLRELGFDGKLLRYLLPLTEPPKRRSGTQRRIRSP